MRQRALAHCDVCTAVQWRTLIKTQRPQQEKRPALSLSLSLKGENAQEKGPSSKKSPSLPWLTPPFPLISPRSQGILTFVALSRAENWGIMNFSTQTKSKQEQMSIHSSLHPVTEWLAEYLSSGLQSTNMIFLLSSLLTCYRSWQQLMYDLNLHLVSLNHVDFQDTSLYWLNIS